MNPFNLFKSSDKAIDTVSDLAKDASKGIDAMFFTQEEKSQASAKAMEMIMAWQEKMKDENSIRSVTRRIIAWAVVGVYLTLKVGGVIVWQVNKIYGNYICQQADSMFQLVMMVMGTYFVYYGLTKVAGGLKK